MTTKEESSLKGVFLITCCTSTRTVHPVIRCSQLSRPSTMLEALDEWCNLLKSHEADVTPSQLYRGVGFHVVTRIQQILGKDNIRVLTGGQGLLRLDTPIVPYDFTSNKNHPGNILEVVTEEPFVIPLWWSMINERLRGSPHPVADIIDDTDTSLVIVAMNKFFLKYLSDDLLAATDGIHKLRIIVTGKSRSGIPAQLRHLVVQCPKELCGTTMGNRNDVNHRAALAFIRMLREDEDKIHLSPEGHQALLVPRTDGLDTHVSSNSSVGNGNGNGNGGIGVHISAEDVLQRSPDLLKYANPDVAFAEAKRRYGATGGILAFRAAWYKATGYEVATSAENADKAVSALDAIRGSIENRGAKVTTHRDSEVMFTYLSIFVNALKTSSPNAKFNAKDVCSWLVVYCDGNVPPALDNIHRVAQFLASSYESLGLERIKVGQGGGTLYAVKA